MCAEWHTGALRSEVHRALRARLVQRLAGRGEPLFVAGARAMPAAALFAARHAPLAQPNDRLDALTNVAAALWERGAATADEIKRLAPLAVGGACAARLAGALAESRSRDDAEFDAAVWLEASCCAGDEVVLRVLFGARLVVLAPACNLSLHAPAARAIF